MASMYHKKCPKLYAFIIRIFLIYTIINIKIQKDLNREFFLNKAELLQDRSNIRCAVTVLEKVAFRAIFSRAE